jgi:hypothetical protein
MRPLHISAFLKLTLEKFLQFKTSSERPNISQLQMRIPEKYQKYSAKISQLPEAIQFCRYVGEIATFR